MVTEDTTSYADLKKYCQDQYLNVVWRSDSVLAKKVNMKRKEYIPTSVPSKYIPGNKRAAYIRDEKVKEELKERLYEHLVHDLERKSYNLQARYSANSIKAIFIRKEWVEHVRKDKIAGEKHKEVADYWKERYDQQEVKVLTGNSKNPVAEYKQLRKEVEEYEFEYEV